MSTYEFGVQMACNGCVNSVDRVLKRLDGVKNVNISLEDQKVLVDTDGGVEFSTVQDTISKTGKKVLYGIKK